MKKRTPPPASLTYSIFQNTFKAISHVFFREIKLAGLHNVPTDGPCIFIVGPHANQFVDGIVLFGANPRPSYAIMAAVSYNRPLIGHVGKILNAIPVVRPQDVVIKGEGLVFYDPDNDPLTIRGQGTKFTQDIHMRDFIIFGRNRKFHVATVLSDTECQVTHAMTIPADEREPQGYSYRIAPHIDQTTVYNEVNSYLYNNECITIFPEGGSHDRPDMLPLKAGFAVMALGAMAEYPDMKVNIVPVGMNYFHPDRFRSRAVVSFGQPFTIDRDDVDQFKLGGIHKRAIVTKLLDKGDEAFKIVTTTAPDMDTLMVIQAVRRLYMPCHGLRPTLEQVVQMNQHLGQGWAKLKDDPECQALSLKVKMYNNMLNYFGIRDHQVGHLDMTPVRAFRILVKRLVQLGALASMGAPA
ncbi:hypothetical protein DM01DRAFT_1342469 [Hesseltinella vesiculosa]|uniref:Phospholipid/glycerol acyltransferase domain-containing protein n=1 Tax=Hesseltinella vesiculosa TaxID=101127 RepID=A0A1X2GV97_9FUNG|nr:hypothetical protein DM01DRAFT_1342469 [Hesseltinella vesiculosa]